MPTNIFAQTLQQSLGQVAAPDGLDVLRDFCQGVVTFVGSAVECEPVASDRLVNYGQEYKVWITQLNSGFSSTLLRAYLEVGRPPHLDIYDGRGPQPCADVGDFQGKLIAFLQTPGVVATLAAMRDPA